LVNGDLQNGLTGWTLYDTATFDPVTRRVRLRGTYNTNLFYVAIDIPQSPQGKIVVLSFDMWSSGGLSLYVMFNDVGSFNNPLVGTYTGTGSYKALINVTCTPTKLLFMLDSQQLSDFLEISNISMKELSFA
jgi:hypothetical protein